MGPQKKILPFEESFVRPYSIRFLSFCDPILFLSFVGFQLCTNTTQGKQFYNYSVRFSMWLQPAFFAIICVFF